jgi:hypothetical protein
MYEKDNTIATVSSVSSDDTSSGPAVIKKLTQLQVGVFVTSRTLALVMTGAGKKTRPGILSNGNVCRCLNIWNLILTGLYNF